MERSSVSHTDTSHPNMTRTIPPSLGPILTELELESPQVVSLAELTTLAKRARIGTEPRVVADRLRKLGWLLPTQAAGVWFGPRGSLKRHSSRFSVADTLLPFDPASLHPAP